MHMSFVAGVVHIRQVLFPALGSCQQQEYRAAFDRQFISCGHIPRSGFLDRMVVLS